MKDTFDVKVVAMRKIKLSIYLSFSLFGLFEDTKFQYRQLRNCNVRMRQYSWWNIKWKRIFRSGYFSYFVRCAPRTILDYTSRNYSRGCALVFYGLRPNAIAYLRCIDGYRWTGRLSRYPRIILCIKYATLAYFMR